MIVKTFILTKEIRAGRAKSLRDNKILRDHGAFLASIAKRERPALIVALPINIVAGIIAAIVFNTEFFPKVSPAMGTLAAFGTFGVGFLFRPLGGFVFGHYGDRLGRKVLGRLERIERLLIKIEDLGAGFFVDILCFADVLTPSLDGFRRHRQR